MRYLIILSLLIAGCKLAAPSVIFPTYDLENHMDSQWLDMREGKWVLYNVEAPSNVASDLENKTYTEFSKLTNDFVSLTSADILIEKEISTFDKEQLKTFKEDLSADYLIHIRTEEGEAETMRNTERDLDAHGNNEFKKKNYYAKKVITQLNIYDLNQQKLIYSKSAKGEAFTDEAKATNIHTSAEKMMEKTLDMLLNDLKQNSYHK